MPVSLRDLRASVVDRTAFTVLEDYRVLSAAFLDYLAETTPTRIVSPSQPEYVFYQFGQTESHKITRPLNSNLYITSPNEFQSAFERFATFLDDLKHSQEKAAISDSGRKYVATNELNRVIYTLQQSIGCISDSFAESNQARKRTGQLFENLIKLIIREIGLVCEPRTIKIPIPNHDGYEMRYELDVVFSRNRAILAAEIAAGTLPSSDTETVMEPQTPTPAAQVEFIGVQEIVGSVKTTSKDRIDKVFLDKFLLTRFLGRDIPVVAVFLHDVQRAATARGDGKSIFGVASTFKTGHFLGYTVALNKLDGVYYVDPRPEMRTNPKLQEQIKDFQQFFDGGFVGIDKIV